MLKVLRPAIARVLTPAGHLLARTPVTPNAVTIIGAVGMSAGALWLFPTGHLFAGVLVCTGFVLADMLDGTLARIKGATGKFGAFLDSTMDRIADAAVFIGLAVWFLRGGHDKLLAGVAVFCLVAGALVSYTKARAESLGLECDVGFAERTERLLLALVPAGLAGLGVPYILPIGLWFLAAASAFTFGQRVLAARRSAAALAAAAPVATELTSASSSAPRPAATSGPAPASSSAPGPASHSGPASPSGPAAPGASAGRGGNTGEPAHVAGPSADRGDARPGG